MWDTTVFTISRKEHFIISAHCSCYFPFRYLLRIPLVNWQGIPGWDKVDRLAVELLLLKGISVTKKQAERMIHLYDELDEYDKRPLTYKSVIRKPSTGRFARSKHRSGHVGTEAVAR